MSNTSRIPAWRRLGLALKNESQSEVSVPDSTAAHDDFQAIARDAAQDVLPDNAQSPRGHAISGKSSKLGKRKHQTEPAEDRDLTAKKTKTSRDEHISTGPPHSNSSTTSKSDDAIPVQAVPETSPSAETAQPKGDPNYRKKKPKPNKRRSDDSNPIQKKSKHTQVQLEAEGNSKSVLPTLLASTENDHTDSASFATPQRLPRAGNLDYHQGSGSPPQTDRRKSVAFTPDTKTSDGHTGQDMFKKWAAEQKGTGVDSASPQIPEGRNSPAGEVKLKKTAGGLEKNSEAKAKVRETAPTTAQPPSPSNTATKASANSASPSAAKGKKKDPAFYISYLTQYHKDRPNWKFNKAKQNDVIDNALNVFRIPNDHVDALLGYISGLQGAGVISRLRERCEATLIELKEQDAQDSTTMDDNQQRNADKEEALQERLKKEKKRRKLEGDIETLTNHASGDGYIRRLQRSRAEALLTALGRAAPILPTPANTNGINPMMKDLAPPARDNRKRKRRTDISSDESSSESSSDDSSSSDSDSEDNDSDSDSSSSSSSSGDSDSDNKRKGSGKTSSTSKVLHDTGDIDSASDSDSDDNSDSESD